MLAGIQLIGIIFSLFMIYLTFLYFKRDDYGKMGFFFWMLIWLGFLTLVAFPKSVYNIMELLSIERTADFVVSGALLVFSVVIFKLYVSNKKLQYKIDSVVRKVALDKAYRGAGRISDEEEVDSEQKSKTTRLKHSKK
jgi:hypothetical protein